VFCLARECLGGKQEGTDAVVPIRVVAERFGGERGAGGKGMSSLLKMWLEETSSRGTHVFRNRAAVLGGSE